MKRSWACAAMLLCVNACSVGVCVGQEEDLKSLKMQVTRWAWDEMGDMKQERELPRLVTWKDGGILVIGGGSELKSTALKSTEIFDPKGKVWTVGPELMEARRDAEVVTCTDGRVLVIGGSSGPTRTGSSAVEVLDPTQNKSSKVRNMRVARIGHTTTLLADGRVLVLGGQEKPDAYLKSAEVYDPAKDEWSAVADMNEVRSLHHARKLKDGTVLVIGGGTDTGATCTCELFDPKTGTWSYTGKMREPRWGFASAVLEDGKVIVAGGRVPAQKGATLADDQMVILRGVEIYDPKDKSWSSTSPMNIPRTMGLPNVELARLPNGGLMFVGGRSYPAPYHGVTSAEYYNPKDGGWTQLSPMLTGRSYQAWVVLPGDEVLVVGGRGPKFLPLKESECFNLRLKAQ